MKENINKEYEEQKIKDFNKLLKTIQSTIEDYLDRNRKGKKFGWILGRWNLPQIMVNWVDDTVSKNIVLLLKFDSQVLPSQSKKKLIIHN